MENTMEKRLQDLAWFFLIACLVNMAKVGVQFTVADFFLDEPQVFSFFPPVVYLSLENTTLHNSIYFLLWLTGNYVVVGILLLFGVWIRIPIHNSLARLAMLTYFCAMCLTNSQKMWRHWHKRQPLGAIQQIALNEQFTKEHGGHLFVYNSLLVLCIVNLLPLPGLDGTYLVHLLSAEEVAKVLPASRILAGTFLFLVFVQFLKHYIKHIRLT